MKNRQNTNLLQQFQKYQSIATIPKIPIYCNNSKNTNLLQQFQKSMNKSLTTSIPQTHKYMTEHFPGLVQALQ